MKQALHVLAGLALVCAAGTASATTLTFEAPGVIDIDLAGVAT